MSILLNFKNEVYRISIFLLFYTLKTDSSAPLRSTSLLILRFLIKDYFLISI